MSADTVFLFGAVISLLSLAPLYLLVCWGRSRVDIDKAVNRLFLGWCALFLLEYFILGPYSFVAQYTDSYFIGYQNYLAKEFNGDRFTHIFGGGQDAAIINTGFQYFQPVKMILTFFDPWVAILFHKAMIVAIGFSGSYLLARRMTGASRPVAFAVASIFPMSHLYLMNFSVEFGTGFAVLPLGVYVCTVAPYRRHFMWWVLGVAVLVALAQPMKVFPPLAVAVVGGMMIAGRVRLGKSIQAFSAFIIASLLNWHEVLYGLLFLVKASSRGYEMEEDIVDLPVTFLKTTGFYADPWIATSLIIFSILVLIFLRDAKALRAAAAFIWVGFAFVLADSFPWQDIGMAFLNRVEHGYLRLVLCVLFVPVTAWALQRLEERLRGRDVMGLSLKPVSLMLALSLGLMVWNKAFNLTQMMAFGGQAAFHGFDNLKTPHWAPREDFRVVTLFDAPHSNIVASFYGLESFGGAHLINPKPWNDYWYGILHSSFAYNGMRIATRPRLDWDHWNGEVYNVAAFLNLDLLRIANVRFILSALPLTGQNLRLVDGPDNQSQWAKAPPSMFAGRMEFIQYRLSRIFDPGKLFIYEIEGSLPRVFAAKGIDVVPDEIEGSKLFTRIRLSGLMRRAVVAEQDAQKLQYPYEFQIRGFEEVPDGYDVRVAAPEGGVLLVNTLPNAFWKAWADGKPLSVVAANKIQLAISIPPGSSNVKIRYKRPLLREVLFTGVSD